METDAAGEGGDLPPLGVARGQLHETYIVAQTADGIVIVDKHAAHERLMYERMKRELANGRVARQPLLIPEVVELDPSDVVIARPSLPTLVSSSKSLGPTPSSFARLPRCSARWI